MTIINYCVFCNTGKRSVVPWQICAVNPPSLTFRNFFLSEVLPQCGDNCEIADVFVGKSKESLDRVNYELVIADVICVFGPFVKFNTITEPAKEQVCCNNG
jgi:hypothetical protein